jgi:hypothetical protein
VRNSQNWENIGWRVNVSFVPLLNKMRPKDHMGVLRAVLPKRYSPLQATATSRNEPSDSEYLPVCPSLEAMRSAHVTGATLALSVRANPVAQLRMSGSRRSVWSCRGEWKDSGRVGRIFALFQ